MKTIDLTWHSKPVLIVPCGSGVIYTRQTGGVLCNHPGIEGVAIPLDNDALAYSLDHVDEFHIGCCGATITPEQADTFDAELKRLKVPLVINRLHLASSEEAWLHVLIQNAKDMECEILLDFEGEGAILTWENCD